MSKFAPPVGPTFREAMAARKAGRKVELSAEQRALSEKVKRAFARRPPKLVEQQQETIGTVERLSPRRRRVFSSLKLNMGARLLRGRPHGHAPRNTSRLNNGRTRRPTRRATSARRTRSGARSSPSGSSDGSEPHPADGAGALTESLASTACWLDAVGLVPWPGWDDLERESNARWAA